MVKNAADRGCAIDRSWGLGLECRFCERIYVYLVGRDGIGWIGQLARDLHSTRWTVKKHLGHLLDKGIVKWNGFYYYVPEDKRGLRCNQEKGSKKE